MNSTGGPAGSRGLIRWPLTRRWVFAALSGLALAPALAQDNPMPRPPLLERDVQFWIRVYTQIDTNAGLLHDQYNLSVVYDTLHFAPNTTPAEREHQVDQAREHYGGALRRIADAADAPLSAEDQRIKELWGAEGTPARLRSAIEDIRFQLGQADRFRAGLIRSGAWETHIAETLANLGLPAELAVLPHVESSFNPAAYSKVGAAGLWQFMRSPGRRYMRIDSAVDDRLDPFRSTEAAAQLLAYNHRVLGTWPLALTAYNHGTAGVRRAKETLGTDDIVRIVRSYSSRTFGFASRNFYVSFLAALDIDRNPEKYFGALQKQSEARFQEVQLPAYVPMATLERTLKIDAERLRALNPALLRSAWDGQQRVPKAYHLRLPLDGTPWTRELLAQRLSPGEMFPGQSSPPHYRVHRGATLSRRRGAAGRGAARERRGRRCRRGLEGAHGRDQPATGVGGTGGGAESGDRSGGGGRAERRSERLQRGARRHDPRGRGRDAGALRRLAQCEHAARARDQSLQVSPRGADRPAHQAGFQEGVARGLRGGPSRVSPAAAGGLFRRAPHRRHPGLHCALR